MDLQALVNSSGPLVERVCSSYWHGWTPSVVAIGAAVALIVVGYSTFELGRARGARSCARSPSL
ncbi:MAG TPA: hypothetical protein VGL83_08135 [Stellaceae bacterium]|jgi:hypothetical protein